MQSMRFRLFFQLYMSKCFSYPSFKNQSQWQVFQFVWKIINSTGNINNEPETQLEEQGIGGRAGEVYFSLGCSTCFMFLRKSLNLSWSQFLNLKNKRIEQSTQ